MGQTLNLENLYNAIVDAFDTFCANQKYTQKEKVEAFYHFLTNKEAGISFLKMLGLKETELQELLKYNFQEGIISIMLGNFYDYTLRYACFESYQEQSKKESQHVLKEIDSFSSTSPTHLIRFFQQDTFFAYTIIDSFLLKVHEDLSEKLIQDSFLIYYQKMQNMIRINPFYRPQTKCYVLPELLDHIIFFYYFLLKIEQTPDQEFYQKFSQILQKDPNITREFLYNFYFSYKMKKNDTNQSFFLKRMEEGQITPLVMQISKDKSLAQYIARLSLERISLEEQLERKFANMQRLQHHEDLPKELSLSISLYEIKKQQSRRT